MKHYIDELALKLAFDHYEENRFIWTRFSYDFEEYLKEEANLIIAREGGYFD